MHKLIRSIDLISSAINNLLNKYRQPSQSLLESWFENLWNTLESEDKRGHTDHKTWYQTAEGLKPEGSKQDQSIYNVRILQLTEVAKNRQKYFPEISETTLSAGIFPDTQPEIETRRLDLKITDKSEGPIIPLMEFSRYQYHKPGLEQKFEIRFSDGKELSRFEVNTVRSIFDTAIGKLNKY